MSQQEEQYAARGVRKGSDANLSYRLRAGINNTIYDICDYEIQSKDAVFTTTDNGKTFTLNETEYLIILDSEKENILKVFERDGKFIKISKKDYQSCIKFKNESEIIENADTQFDSESESDFGLSTQRTYHKKK